MRFTVLLLVLAIAGCTGGPGGADDLQQPGPLPPSAERVATIDLMVNVSAGTDMTDPYPVSVTIPANNGGSIIVPEGVAALLVEANWSCDSVVSGPPYPCAFRVMLLDPQHDTAFEETAEGSVRFLVEDPLVGEWEIIFWGERGVGMTGQVRATVFRGGLPADNFTAFA